MATVTKPLKAKPREIRSVIVYGAIEESNHHSLKILCSADNKSRWFKRKQCAPSHRGKIGDPVSATVPLTDLRDSNGRVPMWACGGQRSQRKRKGPSALSLRLKERPGWKEAISTP